MVWWRPLLLVVMSVLAGIVPLAYASPPDPTWFAGFWDDADFDDVVVAVTNQQAALDAAVAPPLPIRLVVFHAAAAPQDAPEAPARATTFPRAPPIPSSS